ncbi:MAG: hypothetical protein L0922_04930 [Candidatus Mariimomonas ferrooxydans]
MEVSGTIEKGESPLIIIADYTTRILMGIRNIAVTYNQSNGSLLPGYMPSTSLLGMQDYNGTLAPGWAYILGWQDPNFPETAIRNDWLSKDPIINSPYIMNHSNTFNIRSTVEPLPGLRIDLTANRNYTENINEYYIADMFGNFPDSTRSHQMTGNFSISTITIGTAFEKVFSSENFASATFEKFKHEYRQQISTRLALERAEGGDYFMKPDTNNPAFWDGYGESAQSVLIPAFLAAYAKRIPTR